MAVDTRRYLSIDEATGRGKFIRAIQTSAGAGDADKIFALDSAGKIDPSFLYSSISEPDTQIVYGTGSGVDSSSEFTYDSTTGALSVGNTSVASPGTATFVAANASTGNVNGGNVVYGSGQGSGTGDGGSVTLRASQGGTGSGATGGTLSLITGAGGVIGSVLGNGGDISIRSSAGVFGGADGNVDIGPLGTTSSYLNLAAGSRSLKIHSSGSWDINGVAGTNGQVIQVNGSVVQWSTLSLNYVPIGGGTMTGFLTLHADPTSALHASTKQYTDTKLALSGGTLTGTLVLNADPTLPLHAATKQYVDNLYAGLDPKANVRVATTANIDLSSAPSSIDGVTLSSGDRVLVKDQSTGSQNGIYVFNGTGSAMTRSADADGSPANEVTSGMYCFAIEGTANAESGWLLTTSDPITVGTTALTFAQFNVGGGSGTPGGSTYQLQYNNAGVFGALSFGTTGQVLTSAGNGVLATWNTPTVTFANVTSTPTTLAGYGITDAYTTSEVYTQDEVLALIIALG